MAARQNRADSSLLRDMLKKETHLEFRSNKEVIIEECKGILEYGEKQVRINGSDCILRFQGRDLQLCTMTEDSIVLSGHIERLEFLF